MSFLIRREYMYRIEKDICYCGSISVKLLSVCVCLSSGDLFIFFPFFSYFFTCVSRDTPKFSSFLDKFIHVKLGYPVVDSRRGIPSLYLFSLCPKDLLKNLIKVVRCILINLDKSFKIF